MKKVLLLVFIFCTIYSFATHNRAGEILYKRIAPFTATVGGVIVQVYTYSFTVIHYTNDGPNIADRCVDTLHFGDGTSAVAPRSNGGFPLGCGCDPPAQCGEIIVNIPNYIIKKNIFVFIHTYASPGTYTAYTSDPNRNAGILNMTNSVNEQFYIESLVVANTSFTYNSSPVFANPPIDGGFLNNSYYHNPCAYDADGDSLSYQVVPCQQGPGQICDGYTYPNTQPGGSFSINPATGLVTWNEPQLIGEYAIAVKVTEWRKIPCNGSYYMMGYVIRDMQIIVNSSSAISFSASTIQDTCIVAGTNFSKNFSGNATASISIYGDSNDSLNLPNSTLTNSLVGGNYTSSYLWSTNCNDIRKFPYQINLVFSNTNLNNMNQRFYGSFNLKVVPPAPNVYSVQVSVNTVNLFWHKPACTNNMTGYTIYRKIGTNTWSHSACETGAPAYTGFYFLASNPVNDTTLTDNSFWAVPPGSIAYYIVVTEMNDCSESFALINTVSLMVGLKEYILLPDNISVFPNPFSNKLEIDLKGQSFDKIESSIFSADEKLIFHQTDVNCKGSLFLKTDGLISGLYFLSLKTEKGTITKKIIKE